MGQQQTAAPATLPANFSQWDAAPDTLPASHSQWDTAPELREKGEVVPEGGFGIGHYLEQSLPSGSDMLHALGLPSSQDEADKMAADEAAHPVRNTFNRLKSFLYGGPAVDAAISMGKEGARGVKGMISGDPNAGLHMASAMNPLAAPVVDAMSERGLGTPEANAVGIVNVAPMIAGETVPRVAPPLIRGTARAVNTVLEKAPGTVGAAAGGSAAHALGLPPWMGAAGGYALARDLFPTIKIPGEKFGLSDPQLDLFRSLKKVNDTLPDSATADSHPATHQAVQDAVDVLSGIRSGPESIPRTPSGEIVLNQAITALDKPMLMRIAKARGIDTTTEASLIPSKAEASLVKKIQSSFTQDELDEARELGLELSRNRALQDPNVTEAAGREAWHYKVMKQFFPDVELPKAMQARAMKTIAQRPDYSPIYQQAAKESLPAGTSDATVKARALELQSEDESYEDLLQKSIDMAKAKKNGGQ